MTTFYEIQNDLALLLEEIDSRAVRSTKNRKRD